MEPSTDQPPRGSKRPLADDDDIDIDKASGARRYGYDFVDDDEEGGGGGDTAFLDESGTFVERAARGGTKEDAWLGTADDADTAPAATKRARKALRKQEEDERLVDDLVSSRAVFELKKRIVGLLEPGETVPSALRRLKGGGASTTGKGGGASATAKGGASKMDEAARRAFDELTDAAAELVERGDLDAYSDDREALESAAWVYEYGRRARASASAAQEVEEGYEADLAAASTSAGAKTVATDVDAGGQAANPDQPAAPRDASGATPEEPAEGTGAAGSDYVYDPASGYYYSSSTGYFYDAASGCYCSASTGTWFSYDHHDGQCSGTGKEM
jgi:CD2 antigen cytoplasmic tail-binding protein 2